MTAPVVKDSGARAVLPPFGPEHEELRQTVERFVSAEVAPHVDEWEAARELPRDLYRRCAELGFLGLKFPEAYGGQGGDHLHDAVWVEELARSGGSGGVAAGLNAHASIALPPIFNFGDEEQRQRWVVPGIAGEKIGALGITEPGAGSDVAGITTTARRTDGGYVVNGAKTFITNGVRADFLVCACKTTEAGGHDGISFLILERDMPGYEVTSKLEKLGWHSSDTGELSFTDVEVPAANLLGEENGGFRLIMANFAWERLLMAIGAVGAMQRLIDTAVAYASDREAFGRPIGKLQAIRHQIAAMATKAGSPAPSPTTPSASSTPANPASERSRWPSSSPNAPSSGSPTRPSRSTAATATPASTASSAPCATPASARSAAALTR
jgi:acyl-CoA dehydrogenase